MEPGRVLVISDSADRRNFLQYYIKDKGMKPIWYPNLFAARKAVSVDSFSMIVVDLSIPLNMKLDFVRDSCANHPETKVITIGKRGFLETNAALLASSSVTSLDSIESFPEKLHEYDS